MPKRSAGMLGVTLTSDLQQLDEGMHAPAHRPMQRDSFMNKRGEHQPNSCHNRGTGMPVGAALCAALTIATILPGIACGPKATFEGAPRTVDPKDAFDEMVARIKADPMHLLRRSLTETQTIETLRLRFQRQSRLGFPVPALKPKEDMITEFRRSPFSVRFTWTHEDSDWAQCVYVEGQNDGKVVLMPRKGAFGMKPSLRKYPPHFAVLFHQSRNPITDFGPQRMMERTIDRIEKAQKLGELKMRYVGVADIGPAKEPCFHIEVIYPPQDEFECKLHDLYIHTNTFLPVASYLWLSRTDERSDDTLDAFYVYAQMQPNVPLSENDFVIDVDPAKAHVVPDSIRTPVQPQP